MNIPLPGIDFRMTDSLKADLRRAGRDDCGGLYTLYGRMGKKEAGYFERCLAEQEAGRREILIARAGGVDIGYGMLNMRPQYALYKRLEIPEIQDLNVVPEARRQGAATVLIKALEDIARRDGRRQIGISVGLFADYGPAQRLYVKLGYVPDGYGVTYDRVAVSGGEIRPVDDDLCLMLVKDL
jgi:GNAT superfamily N-acetyltransferase